MYSSSVNFWLHADIASTKVNLKSFSIGRDLVYADNVTTNFTGYICEIAFYNTGTNIYNATNYGKADDNFTKLENYFKNKWNITMNA